MVTNIPHMDDLDVAEYLDVPIFAPEPEVAHLYSTKSGCKRIFASANVDMPPSEYDVYSLGQVGAMFGLHVTNVDMPPSEYDVNCYSKVDALCQC